MRIVVTGGNGQLGQDVGLVVADSVHAGFALSREQLDITNQDHVREVLHEIKPDAIIHTAAYTQVDQAETDVDQAYLVNAFGTRNVATVARELDTKMCYVSTDYVFDGTGHRPYQEYDRVNPTGIYGKSKLAGEELCKTICTKYFIVRTSWVYGANGNNFVKTMLRLAKEQNELKVVQDQIGSPTYTVDLAEFLIKLVESEKYGIYHASNTGACSWYEFAQAIFEEANLDVKVLPVTTEDFPRPAPRPKYSVMDHMSIRANGFEDLRHWRLALKDFLQK